MGYVVRYVLTDRKTGRLSYRRAFPYQLRPFIHKSPRELKVSLEAKSLKNRKPCGATPLLMASTSGSQESLA